MLNIIIPMAGRGKRFSDAGYDRPKPFILVDDVNPMIKLVLENLSPKNERVHFIFLCLSDFLKTYGSEFRNILDNFGFNFSYDIVEVKEVTKGAACTVLLAQDKINNDDELIIANCDQLVLDDSYMESSLKFYRYKKADGGILCFLNDSPKWSYCRMSGDRIVEVVEKQVISNVATVGIYYFRQGKMFVGCANRMIANNDMVKGEYYCAPVYNYMMIENLFITPYIINDMVGLGTPEDLMGYQKRISSEN